MDKEKFIRNLKKTGICSNEEIAQFMLKNYFLKGLGWDEMQEDMVTKYHCDPVYARMLRESFFSNLTKWSR